MSENDKRLRKDLISQSGVRQGLDGNKKTFSISLLRETWMLVGRLVQTGAGKYGSSFIDHATRFFIACLTGDPHNINIAVEELENFVVTHKFSDNLRKIADAWDAREATIDL